MTNPCPNCGQANEVDAPVCAQCGLTLAPIIEAAQMESTRPEIVAQLVDQKMRAALSNVVRASRPGRAPAGSSSPGADPPDETPTPEPDEPKEARGRATTTQSLNRKDLNRRKAEQDQGSDALALPAPMPAPEIEQGAPQVTIGYDDDNDLVIPRPMVSSRHARLARVPRGYVLEDLKSTNGSSVNGHTVDRAFVAPGDIIGLGSYKFTLDTSILQKLQPSSSGAKTQAMEVPEALKKVITIGREADADIVLDAPQISRYHVRLTFADGGWNVEDLGSSNGLYVNDRHSPVEKAFVTEDDVLFLGSYRFPVSRLSDFLNTGGHESVEGGLIPLPMSKPVVTIGRGDDNDVVIDGPQISRHHARLVRSDGETFIEDLGSANGTFIDGNRIRRARLEPDQTISFGSYAVRLDLARGHIQRSYRGDILLQAENIRVEIKTGKETLRLLDGISFTVYPTEFMGLLGPSGSGKTTLLMSLIGYLKPTYGRTVVNGDDLRLNYDRYRGAIGYVPQDDIIHRELTVYEALYYTAKLRLPPDTTDTEIEDRIHQVLRDLEIEDTVDLRIGTPERKGISGGQRKRVNLALELLTEPSLLCLDEPTSGLASEDALNVVRLLRRLADGGRTILLTIHQPSLQAYRQLDNALYIAAGEQVYYGPAYPDSMLYFHPEVRPNTAEAEAVLADPGNCMQPIMEAQRAGEPMETLAARYRQSAYHDEYVEDRRKNRSGVVKVTGSDDRRPPRFTFRQFFTLCRRYLAVKLKDRIGMLILIIQAPVIAILLNLVFVAETGGVMSRLQYGPFALFLLVISAIWFGCSNAAREIVSEQAIYRRERMVNLSISAYVLSKFTILGFLCLLQCVVLLTGTYFVLDFWGNPVFHLALLWASSMVGVGMGLFLSSIVRTSEAAMAMVPLLLIPQVILGGAIMPVEQMKGPTWVLAQATVSRWAFEGTLQAEHLADAYEIPASEMPEALAPGLPAPPPPPNPIDRFFGDSETMLGVDLGVLAGMWFLLIICVALALKLRERSL